jgi:hypothetical protein
MSSTSTFSVKVGWAEPVSELAVPSTTSSSSDNNSVNSIVDGSNEKSQILFNFHITFDGYEWKESVKYNVLASIDNSAAANSEEFASIQFPNLSNKKEYKLVTKILQNENDFHIKNLKVLEKYRRIMQSWANYLLTHIHKLDEGFKHTN